MILLQSVAVEIVVTYLLFSWGCGCVVHLRLSFILGFHNATLDSNVNFCVVELLNQIGIDKFHFIFL